MVLQTCRHGSGDNAFEKKQPSKREETFYRWVESLDEKRDQLMLAVGDAILRIRGVCTTGVREDIAVASKWQPGENTNTLSSFSFFPFQGTA